ncbi:hypothetical protein ACWGLO_37180 [Streptomyces niveus]
MYLGLDAPTGGHRHRQQRPLPHPPTHAACGTSVPSSTQARSPALSPC